MRLINSQPGRWAVVAIAATILAACSGDDDGAPDAAKPSSDRATVVSAGDRLCEQHDTRVEALDVPTDLASLATRAEQTAGLTSDTLASLRDIDVPADDEQELEELWTAIDDLVALDADLSAAASAGQAEEVQSLLGQITGLEYEIGVRADAYGFERCGQASEQEQAAATALATYMGGANRACLDVAEKLAAIAAPTDDSSLAASLTEAVAVYDEMIAAFDALEPPAGSEEEATTLDGLLSATRDALDQARATAVAGDADGANALYESYSEAQQAFADQAAAYGLAGCAP